MLSKFTFTILLAVLIPFCCLSQNCTLTLQGLVHDSGNEEPLDHVHIFVEETGNGAVSHEDGEFTLSGLCEGDYHLVLSHIGCEAQRFFIHLKQDTSITFEMDHSSHVIGGVTVTDQRSSNIQNESGINQQAIADNSNQNLSNLLSSISGVSSLKNGSGISKPVVHGLYGNRLTILNNGIAQSGQQWGNDHSPEIDPLVANTIKVIKGVGTLEYPTANFGSIVLVEPSKIEREPHLHGKASYFYESNGHSNGMNLQLQQYHSAIAWKLNGTFKRSGDRRAPDYYLNNTGIQEANLAVQLEKQISDKLFTNLYFSSFNSILGVLRGSHIGNLTDLEIAFGREKPFYTEETFSYKIDAPRQEVNHHLLKLNSKYFLAETQWLDFTAASQLNNRDEYDVRRSGRSDTPALSLWQLTNYFAAKYTAENDNGQTFKSGLQANFIDNKNNPGTGVLPLIPNYASVELASYFSFTKEYEDWSYQFGAKYQNVLQNVASISGTIPREIIRYDNNFHNINASVGTQYSLSEHLSTSLNIGYATRNPAINELYSNGLHQGVSGIEEGSITLNSEQSLKSTLSLAGDIDHKFSFELLAYYQSINDYIYLQPQDEFRLTIRGAFPVFKYEQTDAVIFGLDASAHYNVSEAASVKLAYSYIRGEDQTNDLPLINIPSNDLMANIKYEWHLHDSKVIENLEFELSHQYVFEQKNLLPSQDFLPAPDGYHLTTFGLASNLQLKKTRLRVVAKVENLFNTKYRNYLNRQRYFADDLGRNISIGVRIII